MSFNTKYGHGIHRVRPPTSIKNREGPVTVDLQDFIKVSKSVTFACFTGLPRDKCWLALKYRIKIPAYGVSFSTPRDWVCITCSVNHYPETEQVQRQIINQTILAYIRRGGGIMPVSQRMN